VQLALAGDGTAQQRGPFFFCSLASIYLIYDTPQTHGMVYKKEHQSKNAS
jgi:hypothetical protein